jgi:hypothetical protein
VLAVGGIARLWLAGGRAAAAASKSRISTAAHLQVLGCRLHRKRRCTRDVVVVGEKVEVGSSRMAPRGVPPQPESLLQSYLIVRSDRMPTTNFVGGAIPQF